MSISWDYTVHADSYASRPPYAPQVVEAIVDLAQARERQACDIGAGTGHLTVALEGLGVTVDAIEPNAAMRSIGVSRTDGAVTWHVGTAEATGMPSTTYRLASFGSSFNVTDRSAALTEVARILKPDGLLAALWNHRDLEAPLQREIEELIHQRIPGYKYGTRRESQVAVVQTSGLFTEPVEVSGAIAHVVDARSWAEGWRSHATLARQAGDDFDAICEEIIDLVCAHGEQISVDYHTRGLIARRNGK